MNLNTRFCFVIQTSEILVSAPGTIGDEFEAVLDSIR